MKKIKSLYYLVLLEVLIPKESVFAGSSSGGISNPINVNSIQDLITEILKIVVALGAPIAVLFLVYSGFKFITAQGKSDELRSAREYFMWTLIGIAILLGAQLLANIVGGTIKDLGKGL